MKLFQSKTYRRARLMLSVLIFGLLGWLFLF